ncbi:gram-negative bacteria-binding protein 3-like [Ptiloglossa arizonensis]|uniref:gram-negative bacteria-binding protein 3-like n=1 Tax=Ptiloglossa arizonensis TaxID=3350558 RepID=UPI003F9F3B4C
MNALSANWLILIFVFLSNVALKNLAQYVPPKPIVEPLYPKGLRMSIPHEDGISLVAYHVKFNEDFQSFEAGTISIDILKTRNGRWTYEDRTTRHKHGDIIYYWIHVVFDGLGYNLFGQHEVV